MNTEEQIKARRLERLIALELRVISLVSAFGAIGALSKEVLTRKAEVETLIYQSDCVPANDGATSDPNTAA